MKKLIRSLAILCLFFVTNAFASRPDMVYTIVNDSCAPCYKNCPFMGLYLNLNIGYSWFNLALHRPEVNDLVPLATDGFIRESSDSFIPAIGFDFYPCTKTPLRFEISYLYADVNFKLNPLFLPSLGEEELFANDRFLVRNTMATLYIDWHTCTRFVPYAGISGGVANLKSYHHPDNFLMSFPIVYKSTETNFSWGATLGTRYFFTNYLFANFQLRYDDLGEILFKNFDVDTSVLPNHVEFQSDYLHETTVMIGLGYVF